jgi:hypothetical protein
MARYVARQEARVHLHLPSIHARLVNKQATDHIPKYNFITHIEAVILAGPQRRPLLQSSADRCADETLALCAACIFNYVAIRCLTVTIIVIVVVLLLLS